MLNRLKRLLPHAAILIGNMYLVFFLIDRVNKAMNFIDNGLTKGLLLILCGITLFNARELERLFRRRRRRTVSREGAGRTGSGAAGNRRGAENGPSRRYEGARAGASSRRYDGGRSESATRRYGSGNSRRGAERGANP